MHSCSYERWEIALDRQVAEWGAVAYNQARPNRATWKERLWTGCRGVLPNPG